MKTILLLATVLASAFGAQAQGTINFFNSNANQVSTNSDTGGIATGLTAPAANLYYYALFYSTSATTVLGITSAQAPDASGSMIYVFNDPNWTLAAYATNSSSLAGRFSSTSINSDGSTSIANLSAGSTVSFVVLGWSANLGSTVADLAGNSYYGWVGESAVSAPVVLGELGVVPAPSLGLSGFTLGLDFIPEPATLALAAAGAAGLFFFRRQRGS